MQKLNLSEERIEFLEVGCGSGHRTHVLAKKLEGIGWGIDPSSEAIKFAFERFGAKINDKPYELHFLKGVADELDFVDNQFNFLHFGFVYML